MNIASKEFDTTTQADFTDVVNEEATRLATERWGWHSPTVEILETASETLRIAKMRSGAYLVDQGFFTESEVENHLNNKPDSERTFDYFSRIDPRVAGVVDKFKAAQVKLPVYDLGQLRLHYVEETALIDELDAFDAVLAYLDHEDQLLMVFGSYDGFSKFRSQGRDFRYQKSHLYSKIFNKYPKIEPSLGLAQRLAVTQVIREMRSKDTEELGAGRQSNHWSVSRSDSTLREERDLARLIDYCLENEINDISLKPDSNGSYLIGVRRYGDIVTPEGFSSIEPAIADKIKRFLLTISGANPSQVSRILNPRDGSISYTSSSGSTFMRCSFIPTNHRGDVSNSTSISLRLLPEGRQKITLSDLNLSRQLINDSRNALQVSSGLILIVGPTNSGKSTTIAGAMNEHIDIYGDSRKRLSLEDPIERFIDGVTQFEPFGESEDRFDQMLRAFKRHDPDVVWVGEVRDQQTAELCVDTSASGHLVMTTLHAKDTVTGVDLLGRLVPSTKTFQLIESISLVISQRLVKTVCPECSSEDNVSDEEIGTFESYLARVGDTCEIPTVIRRANRHGCSECRQGYNGMVPINESLPMTRLARNEALDMIISQRSSHQSLAQHRSLTMLDSAMELVKAGRVELLSILT